jgi:hypothetical protein
MIILSSTTDTLQVTTSAAVNVDVHASWVDNSATAVTPGRTNTQISTATTTNVVAAPAAATQRNIKSLHICNRSATTSTNIVVQHTDGTTPAQLYLATLTPGDAIEYTDAGGFVFPSRVSAGAGGGNVSSSGTPTAGQLASWTDATHIQGIATASLGFAPLASPAFTGIPTAPTAATADSSTTISTTAFVKAQGYITNSALVTYAPLASPVFTGNPQAPTPTTADNSVSIATTAFVKAQGYLTSALQPNVTATITVGYTFTPFNAGTISTGTFTPAAANGNYQYYINNGAHTLAAPAADSAMDIMVTNGATAGVITFTGFTVGANTGDALTTTNGNRFVISVRRINAISTYTIKALQ